MMIEFARLPGRDIVQKISQEAYLEVYPPMLGYIPKPAHEDYSSRIARGEVWLLKTKNTSRGLIILEEHVDCIFIDSIAVRPEDKGRGYGRSLMAFAERLTSQRG